MSHPASRMTIAGIDHNQKGQTDARIATEVPNRHPRVQVHVPHRLTVRNITRVHNEQNRRPHVRQSVRSHLKNRRPVHSTFHQLKRVSNRNENTHPDRISQHQNPDRKKTSSTRNRQDQLLNLHYCPMHRTHIAAPLHRQFPHVRNPAWNDSNWMLAPDMVSSQAI